MKKIILSAIALLAFTVTFGQTEQGKIIVGADSALGFNSIKFEDADESITIFNISPQAGYFVIDNLALGLAADFTSSSFAGSKDRQFLIGPFARYYFLEGPIKPFLQAEFLFGSNKSEFEDFNGDVVESKESTTALGITGGASFFLNDFIALDAGLSYGALSNEADFDGAEKVKSTVIGFNVGFSLFF